MEENPNYCGSLCWKLNEQIKHNHFFCRELDEKIDPFNRQIYGINGVSMFNSWQESK